MSTNRRRAEQINKLIYYARQYEAIKNKKITTIDPIIRIGKNLYPTLTQRELIEISQAALRVIFHEAEAPTYQTTLFAHI